MSDKMRRLFLCKKLSLKQRRLLSYIIFSLASQPPSGALWEGLGKCSYFGLFSAQEFLHANQICLFHFIINKSRALRAGQVSKEDGHSR